MEDYHGDEENEGEALLSNVDGLEKGDHSIKKPYDNPIWSRAFFVLLIAVTAIVCVGLTIPLVSTFSHQDAPADDSTNSYPIHPEETSFHLPLAEQIANESQASSPLKILENEFSATTITPPGESLDMISAPLLDSNSESVDAAKSETIKQEAFELLRPETGKQEDSAVESETVQSENTIAAESATPETTPEKVELSTSVAVPGTEQATAELPIVQPETTTKEESVESETEKSDTVVSESATPQTEESNGSVAVPGAEGATAELPNVEPETVSKEESVASGSSQKSETIVSESVSPDMVNSNTSDALLALEDEATEEFEKIEAEKETADFLDAQHPQEADFTMPAENAEAPIEAESTQQQQQQNTSDALLALEEEATEEFEELEAEKETSDFLDAQHPQEEDFTVPAENVEAPMEAENTLQQQQEPTQDDPLFVHHVPFGNDLQYRRVCAPVHSSILCLTTRFPFPFTMQDPQYSYPRPVDDRFYELEKKANFIDGGDLEYFRNATSGLPIDEAVKFTLDNYVNNFAEPSKTAVSVWTRRRMNSDKTTLYGVHSNEQGKRVDKFFDNQLILVLGASPTPPVTGCLSSIFGGCGAGGIKPYSLLCSGHRRVRELGNLYEFNTLPEDGRTFLGALWWAPVDLSRNRYHVLPDKNLTESLKALGTFARKPGFKELRKLSFIIEYPLAHAQNQNMIVESFESVEEIQKGFPKLITNALKEDGRRELAEMGYELDHLIAFDAIPQFNPTETGGFEWGQLELHSEEEFIAKNGYPGWKPEYGTKCRGPLPPWSKLTMVNSISRQSFEDNGLDMRFYGRSWEFANRFWWQVTGWSKTLIDCTHSSANSGMTCLHKYFIMTMVDDHFDNMEEANPQNDVSETLVVETITGDKSDNSGPQSVEEVAKPAESPGGIPSASLPGNDEEAGNPNGSQQDKESEPALATPQTAEDPALATTQTAEKLQESESVKSTPVEAVKTPQQQVSQLEDLEHLYTHHLPFGKDLQYRRVCAPVHSSILCLTTRFPFAFAEQSHQVSYPRPVDDRFYELDKSANFIDGGDLEYYRNITDGLPIDDAVKQTLDEYAKNLPEPSKTAVSVWTRRRMNSDKTTLYGVYSYDQGKRVDKFFDNHLILVLGASPAPPVTGCLSSIFGGCGTGGIKPFSQLCSGHRRVRELGNLYEFNTLPEDGRTFIGALWWAPVDLSRNRYHVLPDKNLTESLKALGTFARKPGFKELRKLSFIVEYPLAHAQNQNMIVESFESVEEIQKGFPKLITNAILEDGRRELAEMGYELGHLIAFDAIPQFNPTETGGFDWGQLEVHSEEEFIAKNGYPGWKPDYGTKCRGPLPPWSKLTMVNSISRQSFEDNGLDMRFYARSWEFANRFWWQVTGWSRTLIDCTHSSANSGMSCLHKYFIMTMVDDHFDNLEGKRD